MLPFLVTLSVLLVASLAYLLFFRRSFDAKPSASALAQLDCDHGPQASLLPRSPLDGLSFEDALAITPVWAGLQASSEQMITAQFTAHLGDGMVVTTNAVRFIQQTGEYVVEFSEKGQKLLEVGKATLMRSKETGQMIPKLIGSNGKIIESAKEVSKLKSLAGTLSTLGSLVVSGAHVISGADVAKTIKSVQRDIKFLVEARKNDQLAKLEAIFHSTKQRLVRWTPFSGQS